VEALSCLLVPNPTQQQMAAAPGGMVYDHISLKLQRTELFSEREAILKNWIRMARYFLLFPFCDICQRGSKMLSLGLQKSLLALALPSGSINCLV
jgi:hypothetical protein